MLHSSKVVSLMLCSLLRTALACTPDDMDRYNPSNSGPCCNAHCTEPRPKSDPAYATYKEVVMCRAICASPPLASPLPTPPPPPPLSSPSPPPQWSPPPMSRPSPPPPPLTAVTAQSGSTASFSLPVGTVRLHAGNRTAGLFLGILMIIIGSLGILHSWGIVNVPILSDFSACSFGNNRSRHARLREGGPSPKSGEGGLELEEQHMEVLPEIVPETLQSTKEEPHVVHMEESQDPHQGVPDARVSLTLEWLQEIQADLVADDVPIDFERMKYWTENEAKAYFESGGVDAPESSAPARAHGMQSGSALEPPGAPTIGPPLPVLPAQPATPTPLTAVQLQQPTGMPAAQLVQVVVAGEPSAGEVEL